MDLFRKNIEKRCAYCAHGRPVGETQIVCERKGVMDAADHCRRFAYDPLRRVPPRPAALETEKYSAEDFKL